MDYISREAAIKRVKANKKWADSPITMDYVAELLSTLPAADVRPVVYAEWDWREEWEQHPETHSCDLISCGWYCTGCGIELGDYLTKMIGQSVILDDDFKPPNLELCPACGADMRPKGGQDNA